MRLRIVRPLPRELEGISVSHLAFHGTHDVQAPLCDVLLAAGYALPEDEIAIAEGRAIEPDRRRVRKPETA